MSEKKTLSAAAEATTRELQALVQDLPPAPKAGDTVSLDAAFRRLTASPTPPGLHLAREILQHLTDRFPPPSGRHHGLMLRDDNSKGLDLLLWLGDARIVHLDDEDLNVAAEKLLEMISSVLPLEND